MTKTFTQDDIIRYVYQETSDPENTAIESALICDFQLLDEYHEILAITRQLNLVFKEPSQKSVNKILKYSKFLTSRNQANRK